MRGILLALGTAIGALRFADAEEHTILLDSPGVLYLVDFWALECHPCMMEMPEPSQQTDPLPVTERP